MPDIGEMTTAELLELLKRIAEELELRLMQTSGEKICL